MGDQYLYLPPIRDEHDRLVLRRAELADELEQIEQRVAALAVVIAVAEARSNPGRPEAPSPEGAATRPAQSRARHLILEVLGELPAGAEVTTADLHARMRDGHGYGASPDALRRAAQRLSDQGLVVKVRPSVWKLPHPAGGDLGG